MIQRLKRNFATVLLVGMFVVTAGVFAAASEVSLDAWTSLAGDWKVEGNTYINGDGNHANTRASATVDQTGETLTYRWTIDFGATTFSLGPAAGMHILSDNGTEVQRGNSYLIFQDSEFIRLYKAGFGALNKVTDFPVGAKAGDVHTYRVDFNTTTGLMQVFRNDELVGEWMDPLPLKSGQFISVRTNGTIAAFSDIHVTVK